MILDSLLGANPYAVAIKLGVEIFGIAAVIGGVWWAVSWVEGVYADHLKLPQVQQQLVDETKQYNTLAVGDTAKFNGFADRLTQMEGELKAMNDRLPANAAAIAAPVDTYRRTVNHASSAPGSAVDRAQRDGLLNLFAPTEQPAAAAPGGAGARRPGGSGSGPAPDAGSLPGR